MVRFRVVPLEDLVPVRRHAKRTLEERFWERVEKTSECWYWTGNARSVMTEDGPVSPARVAYELARGPVPGGFFVCHDCPWDGSPRSDPRICVRPAHLFLGTRSTDQRGWNANPALSIAEFYGGGRH